MAKCKKHVAFKNISNFISVKIFLEITNDNGSLLINVKFLVSASNAFRHISDSCLGDFMW